MDGGEVEAAFEDGDAFLAVVGDAAAGTAHGEAGAEDGGVAVLFAEREATFHVGDKLGKRGFEADFLHRVLEEETIFGLLDGVDFRADEFDAVLFENAGFGEFDREIEGRLAADGGEESVGTFFGDDFFEVLLRERLDVGAVGEVGIGHDRRRVGVDEDDFEAVGAEGLGGLGAGVVEFAGLADDDGAGADDEDAVEVCAARH